MNEAITKGHDGRARKVRRTGISLTARDAEILAAALLNPATRSYHYDPLFPSVKVRNERLRLLVDHGFLSRTFPSGSAFGGGIFTIGKAGVDVACNTLAGRGLDMADEVVALQRRRPSLSLLDHALGVSDVYSALCLRPANDLDIVVSKFLPERLVRFEYEARSSEGSAIWRKRCFAPDGAIVVSPPASAGASGVIFLEIDMATVPIERFVKKMVAFSQVAASPLVSDRTSAGTLGMAVVTNSDTRLAKLRKAARSVETSCKVLFSTFREVGSAGLGTEWESLDTESSVTLGEVVRAKGGDHCTA